MLTKSHTYLHDDQNTFQHVLDISKQLVLIYILNGHEDEIKLSHAKSEADINNILKNHGYIMNIKQSNQVITGFKIEQIKTA